MTVIDIGVRQLQRETSRIVRDVEESGTTYRVTVQGRPTSVVLGRGPKREPGATREQITAFWRAHPKPSDVVAAQLAWLDESRDAAGFLGDSSPYDDLPADDVPPRGDAA